MKNKKETSAEFDLFKPIYEIFHELCLMIADLLKEVVVFGYRKMTKSSLPLKKIERQALQVKKTTEAQDALGIDTHSRKEILLKDIDFRRHSFIVGASGFGKTNLISLLQEHSLRENKPIIFFDPKGDTEALETFKHICRKYSRPCYIFSEHYEESISLNPLLEGTVNQICDRIMRSFEWSEQYYRDASRRSLTKALQNLEREGVPFCLHSIFHELSQMESKENLGLLAKLEAIVVSDFGKILKSKADRLTLSKVREERACLYIGLSTQGYGETATAVGKLFFGELLYNSYKSLSSKNPRAGLENPFSIYFDEFGSLVMPEFIELQNKCRQAGLELTFAVQTASDIDRVNPDLTKQIIENACNLFILKQRLQQGAEFFAEAIGTVLSTKKTLRFEDGETLQVGSEREVHELLVHPDLIKNLGIGQCVLLRQGPPQLNLINLRNRKWDAVVNENRQRTANVPDLL